MANDKIILCAQRTVAGYSVYANELTCHIRINALPALLQSKLKRFYLEGTISPGHGSDLVLFLAEQTSLSFVQIMSEYTVVPGQKRRSVRPTRVYLHKFTDEQKKQLNEFRIADMVRGKMLASDVNNYPYNYQAQAKKDSLLPIYNNSFPLSGALSLPEIRKGLGAVFLDKERKAAGKTTYEELMACDSLILKATQ